MKVSTLAFQYAKSPILKDDVSYMSNPYPSLGSIDSGPSSLVLLSCLVLEEKLAMIQLVGSILWLKRANGHFKFI